MADDKKQTVAHFSHPAKINSILESFSEKQLVVPATEAVCVKEIKLLFLQVLV